jgi:hypothetical protein
MDGYILAGCGLVFLVVVFVACLAIDWAWRDWPE